MKNLYKLFGLGAISEEEAVTEKKKIVKAYEEAKDNHEKMMTVYKSYLEASLKVSDNMREINREIQKTAPDGDRVVLLMADTIERLTNTKFARQGWGNLVWVAQTILQQVGALALVADQQQFFLLAKTLHLAVYLCQVHIRCAGNLWLNGCVDDSVVLCLALQKFQRRDAV